MTVQRVVTATCDRVTTTMVRGCFSSGPSTTKCPAKADLDPGDPQPHRTLVEAGWSLEYVDADIHTICPTHTQEAAS